MTASIPSLLQPLKDRLAAATPGPWEIIGGGEYLTGIDVCIGSWDYGGISLEDATFLSNAPTDQAKLIAAIEAVESILAQGLKTISTNPEIDAYERGFDDSTRGLTHKLRAALTQALGGDTA